MTPTPPNPLGHCMLCAEMGTLRSAKYDARIYNRAARAYLCEYHFRANGSTGRPIRGGK